MLLISAELDEVLELSDRIGVMYRGEIVAIVDARTADKEDIGLLMATGGKVSPRRDQEHERRPGAGVVTAAERPPAAVRAASGSRSRASCAWRSSRSPPSPAG